MFSVIFDMDGTLLDTQRIFIPAWDYAGDLQGIKNLGRYIATVCGMNDVGWSNFLIDRHSNIDMEKFVSDVNYYVAQNLVVRFMPGGEKLLKLLKKNGVKIALASGTNSKKIKSHLKKVGATEYVDVIVGGEEVQNGKPAPDVFLLAAKRLGADPKDCYVLEDSQNGVRSGYAAGMKCIGIPDVAVFEEDVKNMLTAEFKSLNEAADYFEKLF